MEECVRGAEGGSASRERLQWSHIALHNASIFPHCSIEKGPRTRQMRDRDEVIANLPGACRHMPVYSG